jgi:TctA family transporter
VLYPTILLLVCLGVYSINNSAFDVLMTIGFGIVGFCLGRYPYPMASLVLGFILSPLLEEHFRRTMLISDGDLTALFQSNISPIFLGLAFLVLISPLWRLLVRRSRTDG